MIDPNNFLEEYELEDEEFMDLTLAMYGHMPTEEEHTWVAHKDALARCNEVWKRVAKIRNLDWRSISPSERGLEYFRGGSQNSDSALRWIATH